MARGACVFIIVFLYGCSAKYLASNDTLSLDNLKSIHKGPAPKYWDWREKGMVSPVKNQLTCNACWAFSAVGSIESHVLLYLNLQLTLSEQFLIDCDDGSTGCESRSILKTFANIVSSLGGVLRIDDYCPYVEHQMACRWTQNIIPIPVIGFRRVPPNEEVMRQYVYQYGPLSTAINSASMADYTQGIDQPTEEKCSSAKEHLNHAVVIVGYNEYVSKDGKTKIPYWIIKNSWGDQWGDKGYYYLERGRNACGIANDVSMPIVS